MDIFEDQRLVQKIQSRLPYLFQLAEIESSRDGKVSMEVGSARERILVALFIYKFGYENVETRFSIANPEIDVKVCGEPLSIKTITGTSLSGVKIKWTVDAKKAGEFYKTYYPSCHILLVQINWGGEGGFFYIPLNAQTSIFEKLGKDRYIRLPKEGTNPRGIEISKNALLELIRHSHTRKIEISWNRRHVNLDTYKRWIELWNED